MATAKKAAKKPAAKKAAAKKPAAKKPVAKKAPAKKAPAKKVDNARAVKLRVKPSCGRLSTQRWIRGCSTSSTEASSTRNGTIASKTFDEVASSTAAPAAAPSGSWRTPAGAPR